MSRANELRDRLTRLRQRGALRQDPQSYNPSDGKGRRWLLLPASGEAERVMNTREAEAFALGAEAGLGALSRRVDEALRLHGEEPRSRGCALALAEEANRLQTVAEELTYSAREAGGDSHAQLTRRALTRAAGELYRWRALQLDVESEDIARALSSDAEAEAQEGSRALGEGLTEDGQRVAHRGQPLPRKGGGS